MLAGIMRVSSQGKCRKIISTHWWESAPDFDCACCCFNFSEKRHRVGIAFSAYTETLRTIAKVA